MRHPERRTWAIALAVLMIPPVPLAAQAQHFTDETADRLPAVLDPSRDADFGDIDGDGDLDVFVSNEASAHQPNFLYVNDGAGHFTDETAARIREIHDKTTDSEFGDVDRDGDLDLLMANYTNVAEDFMYLFFNDGSGRFVQTDDWLPSRSVSFLTGAEFGDIQGNLYLDIIDSSYGSNRLLLNYSWAYYIAPESRYPRGSDESNDIYFGDVDGDFDLDVLVINGLGQNNRLLINDGRGVFTDETTGRLPGDTQNGSGGSFVDVDADGDLDIFIANSFFPGNNQLWINDGAGHFSNESAERMPILGEASMGVSPADIDNDGDFDLIVANLASGGVPTKILVNDGTGHFTDETATRYPADDDDAADIAAGDVDGDGDLDLFVANLGDYPAKEQNRLLINQSTPDAFPPAIPRTFHHPDTGETEEGYLVTSTVWDNIAVAQGELTVAIFYRAAPDTVPGGTGEFTELPMLWSGGHLFRQEIPAQPAGTRVEYYVRAVDRMGNAALDPPAAPDSVYSFVVDVTLGIGDDPGAAPGASLPRAFSLSQNYPNPFNPSTMIEYEIPAGAGGADPGDGGDDRLGVGSPLADGMVPVDLRIYDLRGRLVRTFVDGEKAPGRHSVHWDGRDDHGESVGSGVYLYRLQAGPFASTKKMIVAR